MCEQSLGKVTTRSEPYTEWPVECWAEIEVLMRLCHLSIYNSRSRESHEKNHGHIADMMYLVSLLGGIGPVSMRLQCYAIVVSLLQSLYLSSEYNSASLLMLEESGSPEVLRLFGLSGNVASGHYLASEPATDDERLDNLEGITKLLLTALSKSGLKGGECETRCVPI